MQIVGIPIRSGGLQGFRPGQVSTPPASLPRSADEALKGFFFRTFPRFCKSAQSAGRSSAESPRTRAHGRRRLLSQGVEEDPTAGSRWVPGEAVVVASALVIMRFFFLLNDDREQTFVFFRTEVVLVQ